MQDNGIANLTSAVSQTTYQYRKVVTRCKDLFLQKAADYGTSWRVLRPISLVDQIYIKAWRIRQIQEAGKQQIADSIESEFMGIVNYGIIALIQSSAHEDTDWNWTAQQADEAYAKELSKVESLMLQKNHDYGEAWREMSQQSIVDLILVKLLRLKQIIANDGRTSVSEGMDANFQDIVNYAVFALIRHEEA
ncbi:MAG: DUF1599 domain-containing protein [Chitinophagaceae bacterium]